MSSSTITRRRFLLAGAAALVAAGGVGLAEPDLRHRARALLTPEPAHEVPSGPRGQVVSGDFASAALGRRTGWSLAYPPDTTPGARLPLLLVLHGRGDDHRTAMDSHALPAYLAAAVRAGTPPYALASVDGTPDSYWHQRADGRDPQRMILTELLPLLARQGIATDRLALGGWSMGGYGALLLAERLGARRVAAVAVDSPALWLRPGDSAAGAFDDAADFRSHDVLAGSARLDGAAVRVSCGTSDPFLSGVRALLARLPAAERDLGPGGHDLAWWQHAAPAQLTFVGGHLARR